MERKIFLTLLFAGMVAMLFFTGCDNEPPHLKMLNVGNGEYLYVTPDQNVEGASGLHVGYSLRSTKNDRVVYTFQYRPKEIRLEDFDSDGIKDLIYIVPDPKVKGATGLHIGYSMRVALGKGDGAFYQAKVVATFKSIS